MTKIQIASRKFGRKKWTLNRFLRGDGTGYTELDDGDLISDNPVRYHDGRVVYDRPEKIPQAVREWVSRALDRYVLEARSGSETFAR